MIKKFIGYYKPHLRLFIIDMLAAIIIAVCNLFYPTVVRKIINEYVYNETAKALIIASAFLAAIYVIKAVCNYIVGYYGHVVGIRMQGDMRRDLFKKYESLPFSYYDNHKTGDLISRLVTDLFDVAELAHHGPENLFLAVLMLVGAFVMLFNINVTLTLIMFAFLPVIAFFAILSRRSLSSAMKASKRQIAEVNVRVENSVSGIRETKSYVAEHIETERFTTENALFVKIRSGAMKALGRFEAVMQFSTDILYLVIIFIGGMFLYYGKIDAGDFAAFILYISMFMTPIQRFVALFQQLQEGMAGFSRFTEIMALDDEIDEGRVEISDVRGEIRFESVSFGYGDPAQTKRMVISDFSLTVNAGETVALVGPSGGGKTTVCNLIPRFYNIDSGRILLDGVDISDITLDSLRRNIGTVSQNVVIFGGTLRDNIAYGTDGASDEKIIEAARLANIHDFIMTLPQGYDTEVGERGVKLSGGQRQRVAIARMFMKNPKLLILDEATSALDNATEMLIQQSLERLSSGRTVLVVAHRLSTVKGADKIVVLDEHGIVESGTHEELIAKDGEYKKLYSYQFKQ